MSRLRMLFRHDLTTYSKDKIYLMAIVFVPTILAYFIGSSAEGLTVLLLCISFFTAAFAPFYFASHICANMRTKQDSIHFAMLPATNAEKFLVRFVDYAVLPSFIVLIAIIAVVFMVSVLYSLGHFDDILNGMSMITINIEDLEDLREKIFSYEALSTLICIAVSFSFDMAIAILGGCIFKRFALVKTWLIVAIVSVFFGGFISIIGEFMLLNYDVTDLRIALPFLIVQIVITIGMIYLSYVLFKRKQIL